MDNDLMARRLRPPSEPLQNTPTPPPAPVVDQQPAPNTPSWPAQAEPDWAPATPQPDWAPATPQPAWTPAEPVQTAQPEPDWTPAQPETPWAAAQTTEAAQPDAVWAAPASPAPWDRAPAGADWAPPAPPPTPETAPWSPDAREEVPWDRPTDYEQPTDTAQAEAWPSDDPAWDRPSQSNLFDSEAADDRNVDQYEGPPAWATPAPDPDPVAVAAPPAAAVVESTDPDDAYAPVLGDVSPMATVAHAWPETNGHDSDRNEPVVLQEAPTPDSAQPVRPVQPIQPVGFGERGLGPTPPAELFGNGLSRHTEDESEPAPETFDQTDAVDSAESVDSTEPETSSFDQFEAWQPEQTIDAESNWAEPADWAAGAGWDEPAEPDQPESDQPGAEEVAAEQLAATPAEEAEPATSAEPTTSSDPTASSEPNSVPAPQASSHQEPLVLRIELAIVDDKLTVVNQTDTNLIVTPRHPAFEPRGQSPAEHAWIEPSVPVLGEAPQQTPVAGAPSFEPDPVSSPPWAPAQPTTNLDWPLPEVFEVPTPLMAVQPAPAAPTEGAAPWQRPSFAPPPMPAPQQNPAAPELQMQPSAYAPIEAIAAPSVFAPPVYADPAPVPARPVAAPAAAAPGNQERNDLWFLSTEPDDPAAAAEDETAQGKEPSPILTAILTILMAVAVIGLVLAFFWLMTSILR